MKPVAQFANQLQEYAGTRLVEQKNCRCIDYESMTLTEYDVKYA